MNKAVSGESEGSWGSLADLEKKLRKRLEERHPGDIIRILLLMADGRIELHGQVASEAARSDAVRQLAAFNNVPLIIDRLEVTGYFMPASDDEWFLSDDQVESSNPTMDGGVLIGDHHSDSELGYQEPGAISRYPSITTDDPLAAGRKIRIVVDLTSVAQDSQTPSIEIAHLKPGWEALDVETMIIGAKLTDINPPRTAIRVSEDGSSKASEFTAILSNEVREGDEIKITALFTYAGRFCGSWETGIGCVSSISQAELPDAEMPLAPVTITPEAFAPGLTVTIKQIADGELMWTWTVRPGVPLGPGPSCGVVSIKEAQRYAAGLLAACPTLGPADFRRRMRGIGEQIWKASPGEFKETYLWLRRGLGPTFPIQFIVDEFYVPWEMMRPDTEDDADHLFLIHPVARWPLSVGNWLLQPLASGTVHSFVPDYSHNATLPAAKEEAKWVANNLGAVTPDPTKDEFVSLLECRSVPSKVGLIHFAGHGQASSGMRDAGIKMVDDWVVIDDVNTGGTKLGKRDRSMVVLNACETAANGTQLGWVEGWAPMLATRGFGAVVAPLWRVQDDVACDVVIGGLSNLMKDACTLGEAFTKARASVSEKSVAAFAFVTYGDVMARVASS